MSKLAIISLGRLASLLVVLVLAVGPLGLVVVVEQEIFYHKVLRPWGPCA